MNIGAANMTLNAVAKEAKVSKGGLLYHFPSKEALIQAMVSRLISRTDKTREEIRATLGDDEMADVKAYVLAGVRRKKADNVETAVLAAAAINPRLVAPLGPHQKQMINKLAKACGSPARASVISMAVIGLWLHEVLHISPMRPQQRKKFIDELFTIAAAKTPSKSKRG